MCVFVCGVVVSEVVGLIAGGEHIQRAYHVPRWVAVASCHIGSAGLGLAGDGRNKPLT